MDKENVVSVHGEMLFSFKKKQKGNLVICVNTDNPRGHHIK